MWYPIPGFYNYIRNDAELLPLFFTFFWKIFLTPENQHKKVQLNNCLNEKKGLENSKPF